LNQFESVLFILLEKMMELTDGAVAPLEPFTGVTEITHDVTILPSTNIYWYRVTTIENNQFSDRNWRWYSYFLW